MSKKKDGTYTGSPMVLTRWPEWELRALETAVAHGEYESVQTYIRLAVLAKLKRGGYLPKASQ